MVTFQRMKGGICDTSEDETGHSLPHGSLGMSKMYKEHLEEKFCSAQLSKASKKFLLMLCIISVQLSNR